MNVLSRFVTPSTQWSIRAATGVVLTLGMLCAAEPGKDEPKKEPGQEAGKKDAGGDKARREAYQKQKKAGRDAFGKGDYAAALAHFRQAKTLYPEDEPVAVLAGIAAYWNREPRAALDCLLPIAKETQAGSPKEWVIVRHLILAWHGVGDDQRAAECVQRLYQLRSKARYPQAREAKGFSRQHIWLGKRRVGVWEVFDERGELPRVWEYQVMETDAGGKEKQVALLAIELEPRPDGKARYVLVERKGRRRVYKRWLVKPGYGEARDVALAAIKGELKALDAGTSVAGGRDQPATKAASKKGPAEPKKPVEATPKRRETTPGERERLKQLVALKLSPAATRILAVAARLADVDFDVSRYVRLSVSDPAAARKFEAENLTQRFPHATADASDLVQYVASAKVADCIEAYRHVDVVVPAGKAEYARYVLLTALNTRGGKAPVEFLSSCLKSSDFVVRQTAALLLARGGRREGVEALFKELIEVGEGREANEVSQIVSYYLEELLGRVLGVCPLDDGAPWRKAALAWWKENGPKLEYAKDAKPGQAFWRVGM
jgi:hypothetical protein